MFEKMVKVNDKEIPVGWSLMLVPTPDAGVDVNVGDFRDLISESSRALVGSAADALDAAPDLESVMRLWRQFRTMARDAVAELDLIEETIRETVIRLERPVAAAGVRATYKAGYSYERTSVDTKMIRGMAALIPEIEKALSVKTIDVGPSVKIEIVDTEVGS